MLVRSSVTQYGAAAGAEMHPPWSGPLLASIWLAGALPSTLSHTPNFDVDLTRLDAAAGLAAEGTPSSLISFGVGAAFLAEYLRASLSVGGGATELRPGARISAWLSIRVSRFEARLEPALRLMPEVVFQARPAQGDFRVPGIEGDLVLALGIF
jgi:hypothetical protein